MAVIGHPLLHAYLLPPISYLLPPISYLLPLTSYLLPVAVIGGILYCTGGQTPDGKATPSVERYDPASDQWQEVAPMLHPRFSHAAATLDGRLYVVGGFASGVWLAAVERYDPATDTWEAVGNLSSPVSAPGLAVC